MFLHFPIHHPTCVSFYKMYTMNPFFPKKRSGNWSFVPLNFTMLVLGIVEHFD